MMDWFVERQLSELEKRYWLVVEAYATKEQDQIPWVRMGQLPLIRMKKEEEKKEETEEKAEEPKEEKSEEEKEETTEDLMDKVRRRGHGPPVGWKRVTC